MTLLKTIDRDNKLPKAQDYHFLRKEAIRLVEQLSGNVWSDYNTHDPGITLLETVCFTITDLAYRTSFDMKDLLAPADGSTRPKEFFTAPEILSVNPVTLTDYRKMIIDTEGVKNAWIEISTESEVPLFIEKDSADATGKGYRLSYENPEASPMLPLQGLYKVFVEYQEDVLFEKREVEVSNEIRRKLHQHRNLGEDFISIASIEYEDFPIEAVLQVSEGTDVEKINAKVYDVISNYFSPPITFYTLGQMMEKGFTTDEIFEGPLLKHGFIHNEELKLSERYKDIHLSDIMNLISGIEGVIAIKKLSIPADSRSSFSDFSEWTGEMKHRQKAPRLDAEKSRVSFVRSGDRHRAAADLQPDNKKVVAIFRFLKSSRLRSRLRGTSAELELPKGEYMQVAEYFPFQHTLPAVYGMEESVLDNSIDEKTVQQLINKLNTGEDNNGEDDAMPMAKIIANSLSASLSAYGENTGPLNADIRKVKSGIRDYQFRQLSKRKKQTLQLRGFLLVFEQIFSDYLSQLDKVGKLLSFQENTDRCFYPQPLKGIRDMKWLLLDEDKYADKQHELSESKAQFFSRKNNVLDHLIARFSESFDKYSYFMRSFAGDAADVKLIADKLLFLQEYIRLSNYRGKGFKYWLGENSDSGVWGTDNVEGFKKRVCRLLGISNYKRDYTRTDLLRIEKTSPDNEIPRYVVVLSDPDDRDQVLLRTIEFEDEQYAKTVLTYVLENGSNKALYQTEHRKDRWAYHFMRPHPDNDPIIATTHFSKQEDFESAFAKTLQTLSAITDNENFHVLEHILLRPKITPREKSTKRKTSWVDADRVELLAVPEINRPAVVNEEKPVNAAFRFKIINVQAEQQDKPVWRLSLVDEEGKEVLTVAEDFDNYPFLTRRIEVIRQLGADRPKYVIEEAQDGYFQFSLKENDRTLAEGKKNFKSEEQIEIIIESLMMFFSHENAPGVPGNATREIMFGDPYSFRMSIFIPNWPKRFREPSFKHLLEKTLYLETPAHVYTKVYWLNHNQMKEFEEAYKVWIDEFSSSEIPDTELVNNLIAVINSFQ